MLKPEPMSRPDLLATLKDIPKAVIAEDSYEGSIEYLMPTEGDPDCACPHRRRAGTRVDVSDGKMALLPVRR